MKLMLIPLIFLTIIQQSCVQASDIILFKKYQTLPLIVAKEKNIKQSAVYFQKLFKEYTEENLTIIDQEKTDSAPRITIEIDQKINSFYIEVNQRNLKIVGKTPLDINHGITYFFQKTLSTSSTLSDIEPKTFYEIILPGNLYVDGEKAYDFEYREPYFTPNNNLNFRQNQSTHHMEDKWALWGHNISKFIPVTKEMHALIDGKKNSDQFDFSSIELEKSLKNAIRNSLIYSPSKNNFLIMPNDNNLVCQCEKCIDLGNTSKNATPAVSHLINKLAKEFPEAYFFTSDYGSTAYIPKEDLLPNVGVMISTMDFPKGVLLKNHKKSTEIKDHFNRWNKKSKHLYLWDYAVNFDNYNDSYPTLFVGQENFKFYKDNGIKGIFIQGTENGYSAFEEIKTLVYSELLKNTNTNIKEVINNYYHSKYGEQGKIIANYFIEINTKALENKKVLDIYGGIISSTKKYLDPNRLLVFQNDLEKITTFNTVESKIELSKLKATCRFQLLEIARTHGFYTNGYANFNYKTYTSNTHTYIKKWIDELQNLTNETGISEYNEVGNTFKDYIQLWKQIIIDKSYTNLLYEHPITVLSSLDEDYSNPDMLTDGNLGFTDYYNNWLIVSNDDLILNIDLDKLSGFQKQEINLSFLQDHKHKIHLPESISIEYNTAKPTIIKPEHSNTIARKTFSFPLQKSANQKNIKITIKRKNNVSIACDEVIIK